MRRVCLPVLALLLAPLAQAAPVTVLCDFDTREAVDVFASQVRSAMVEPVSEPRTHGTGAVRLRFFGHSSLEYPPQVLALYSRGGLPYANWQPYADLRLDLCNPGGEELTLELVFRSEGQSPEVTRAVTLPPGQWTAVVIPLVDLAAQGLDLSAVSAFGFRAPLGARPRPTRAIADYVRLTGGDEAVVRAARRAEDATAAERGPRPPLRTGAARMVIHPQPTGEHVTRRVKAPVIATPEVLVVGGGLAGVAAAVTAARMGADVLLVERSGALGGMATTGLVPPAFREQLSGGLVAEFCRRLEQLGGPAQHRNPELMKCVLLEMLQESGAKLMLYSLAVDAIVKDDAIRGVIVENKSGAQAILAQIVIDCTGDGDIAARAGAPFEIGRGRDEQTQTQTLVFLLGNVDTRQLLPAAPTIPDLIRQAREKGDFAARFSGGAAIGPVVSGEHGVVNVNTINIPQVSGLKVEDLTYSHVEAQRQAQLLVDFYRKYVPGCADCYLLSTAEYIGVRESRRILGEYVLTGEDVLQGRQFDDGIARGFYPIDIHGADSSGDAAGARLSRSYDIPYRCLVPRKIENLLVAGRCISADHVAHGSLRVMGTTMPLGEAAGCAAALCVEKHLTPRKMKGWRVRWRLEDLGAWPEYEQRVPDNLALADRGVIATADSILQPGYGARNAIDGLITPGQESRWLSDRTPPPHWLELRFPEPTTFDRVKLHFYSHASDPYSLQYVSPEFEVQVQRGAEWQTVAAVRGNQDLQPEIVFAPVTAQVLRVLFTIPCRTDNIVRLREIEVHNGPGAQ